MADALKQHDWLYRSLPHVKSLKMHNFPNMCSCQCTHRWARCSTADQTYLTLRETIFSHTPKRTHPERSHLPSTAHNADLWLEPISANVIRPTHATSLGDWILRPTVRRSAVWQEAAPRCLSASWFSTTSADIRHPCRAITHYTVVHTLISAAHAQGMSGHTRASLIMQFRVSLLRVGMFVCTRMIIRAV